MKNNLLFIILLIVLTSICDTIRELFLKTAINSLENISPTNIKTLIRFIIKLIRIPWVWFGFLFSILSLSLWLLVLSKADLNFAFSVDSMHYIFIALASRIFLKEKVGSLRWAGTLLIVIGIVIVAFN